MSENTFVNTKKESHRKKYLAISLSSLICMSGIGWLFHDGSNHPTSNANEQSIQVSDPERTMQEWQNVQMAQLKYSQENANAMVKIIQMPLLPKSNQSFLNNYFNLWHNNILKNDNIQALTLPENKNKDGHIHDNNGILVDVKLGNHNQDLFIDSHYRTVDECQHVADYSLNRPDILAQNHVKIKSIMVSTGKNNNYIPSKDLNGKQTQDLINIACHINQSTVNADLYKEPYKPNPVKVLTNTHFVVDYEKIK